MNFMRLQVKAFLGERYIDGCVARLHLPRRRYEASFATGAMMI